MSRAIRALVGALLLASPAFAQPATQPAAPARGLRDVIGVTHIAGVYHLTDRDFLSEGADQVLALGSRVIKLSLSQPRAKYPYNIAWPEMKTLVDVAASPPFRAVFAKPFTTYILTTFSLGRADHFFIKGITPEQQADETRQFHDLAAHLVRTYRGTGKTFVLANWEGDWGVRGNYDAKADPTPAAFQGMALWLAARQAGVAQARAEAGDVGAYVYHAAEVNLVKATLVDHRPGVVDQVLPRVKVDLVSYSAWDTQADAKLFPAALECIAQHAQFTGAYPGAGAGAGPGPAVRAKCVYVGEFGAPENEWGLPRTQATIRNAARAALDWGCPYVVYWQVYCNEPRQKDAPRPVRRNDEVRGFWLVRPDGSRTWAWEYLSGLLHDAP